MLARESFVEADLVSSVPESGTAAAHGFSIKVRNQVYIELSFDAIIYCTLLIQLY